MLFLDTNITGAIKKFHTFLSQKKKKKQTKKKKKKKKKKKSTQR